MRRVCRAAVDRRAIPGERWLEIGGGTGEDALYFTERGLRVDVADLSDAMLRAVRARFRHARRPEPDTFHLPAGRLAELLPARAGGYDGVYSFLGPLNFEQDLGSVARALAGLIRPGGWWLATWFNRWCPAEWAYGILRLGSPGFSLRRFRRAGVPLPMGGDRVTCYPYTPGEVRRAVSPAFHVQAETGIFVTLPPFYAEGIPRRWPRLYRGLERLDDLVNRLPGLRALGDEFLMEMRRA